MTEEVKKLAAKISKQIDEQGWSLDVHTKTLALLVMIHALPRATVNSKPKRKGGGDE